MIIWYIALVFIAVHAQQTDYQSNYYYNKINKNENKRISERKCEEYSIAVNSQIYAPYCASSAELIIGGETAIPGEFPHVAAVGWSQYIGGYDFNCGGALISPRFVLTAGQCTFESSVYHAAPSVVRLGEHNVEPGNNADPIDVNIKAIHQHPDFKPPAQYNDIALLEIDEVSFNAFIRPACLSNQFNFEDNTKAIATGWGVNGVAGTTRNIDLQKVSLSLLDNDDCDLLLFQYRNHNWRGLDDTMLCAGELYMNRYSCQGDSGFPLHMTSKDHQCVVNVVGIASFGYRCGSGRPAVYTRVSKYLDWIESIVWPEPQQNKYKY